MTTGFGRGKAHDVFDPAGSPATSTGRIRVWRGHGPRTRGGAALAVAGLLLAGCGGVGNPFAKATAPELVFLSAAQTWDLDRDNSVTCDEWKSYTTELFTSADTDADGTVTVEEYPGIIRQDRLFETVGMSYFDMNRDGRLTLKEFTETPNPAFRLLDRDNDCRIASAEMVQTRQIEQIKDKGGDMPGSVTR